MIILGQPIKNKNYDSINQKCPKVSFNDRPHIGFNTDGHLLTLAPPGEGKTNSVLLPNALNSDRSLVVVSSDLAISNEIAERREQSGRKVNIINCGAKSLTAPPGGRIQVYTWSPLEDLVRLSSNVGISDSFLLKTLSFEAFSDADDTFWTQSAVSLLQGIIEFISAGAREREAGNISLISVLTDDDITYRLANLLDSNANYTSSSGYSKIAAYLQRASNERSGVLSTLQTMLRPLLISAPNDGQLEFNFSVLEENDELVDFIVYTPSERLHSSGRVARLWCASLFDWLLSGQVADNHQTLMFIDDFPQLGKIAGVKEFLRSSRQTRAQIWIFANDLKSFENCYGSDADEMLGNFDIIQAFGFRRKIGLDHLSKVMPLDDPEILEAIGHPEKLVISLGISDTWPLTRLTFASTSRLPAAQTFIASNNDLLYVPPEHNTAPHFVNLLGKLALSQELSGLQLSDEEFFRGILLEDAWRLLALCPEGSNANQRLRELLTDLIEEISKKKEVDINTVWRLGRSLRQIDRLNRRTGGATQSTEITIDLEVSEGLRAVVEAYNGLSLANDTLRERDKLRDLAEVGALSFSSIVPVIDMVRSENSKFHTEILELLHGLVSDSEDESEGVSKRAQALTAESVENLINRTVTEAIRERKEAGVFGDSFKKVAGEQAAHGIFGTAKHGFRAILAIYAANILGFTDQLPNSDAWRAIIENLIGISER